MDTKLKKTHKLTTLIISLIVLIPALILTALYPRMEEQYFEKREKYGDDTEEYVDSYYCEIEDNFVNYAVEATYYLYAEMLQAMHPETEVRIDALDEYEWYTDYNRIDAETSYYVEYQSDEKTDFRTNTEEDLKGFVEEPTEELQQNLRNEGYVAYLTFDFDAFGKLRNIEFEGLPGSEYDFYGDPYADVKASVAQYERNVTEYNNMYGEDIVAKELLPKSIRGVFLINENSSFIWEYSEGYYSHITSSEEIYLENGVMYIIAILAVFVALMALVLPFFKQLDTGLEKLFSMPFEINAVLCMAAAGMATLMFEAMCFSRFADIQAAIAQDSAGFEIIGYVMSAELVYGIVLVLNFLGWAVCFLMEYIVFANVRQFFCAPKEYVKNRLLFVRFFRWIVKKLSQFYQWVTDIDIAYGLNKSIVKVVLANFVILTILCCMWVFGLAGLIIYSIALYVILRKYGEKLQRQYQSVLNVTEGMADGNLKITMDEDLGIFAPLGEELERVQEGFAKAVREEARSQNMKTELITNVSHDLKTPLTAIITYVDLLKQEGITEEQRASYIDTLDQKSQRLKVLIEDLFEISKANSGNV
ncbi:MAG: histidine kinase dimerization/phospho-acceptor domain-containing protein, partial [bacterium]|nr:histidine kinase dimerization/phospho-acceptor domain-containing protein [bacterium]